MGIKEFFFKDEEVKTEELKVADNPATNTKNSNQSLAKDTVVVNSPAVNQPHVASNVQGSVINETMAFLKETISSNNLPGPDYFELKNAVDALKTAIPEESTRFLAAYATLKSSTPTLTKAYVLESIDTYIKVIEGEKEEANKEFQARVEEEINTRYALIETTKASIELKKDQITKLTEEINAANTLIGETNIEIINRKSELDKQKANFDATIVALEAELNSDKLKINTLITE